MLGALIRDARDRHGLSQARLATRSGVTQASISRIERGLESPSFERFSQIMLVMGERPTVSLSPMEHGLDEGELRTAAAQSREERLREAASWNRVMSRLDGAAR